MKVRCIAYVHRTKSGRFDAYCDQHLYSVRSAATAADALSTLEVLHAGVTKADLYWAVIAETVRGWALKLVDRMRGRR